VTVAFYKEQHYPVFYKLALNPNQEFTL